MEWFFGPKGLKFSEIGARPAGEKIWDMYRVANDFDVFEVMGAGALGRRQPSSTEPATLRGLDPDPPRSRLG